MEICGQREVFIDLFILLNGDINVCWARNLIEEYLLLAKIIKHNVRVITWVVMLCNQSEISQYLGKGRFNHWRRLMSIPRSVAGLKRVKPHQVPMNHSSNQIVVVQICCSGKHGAGCQKVHNCFLSCTTYSTHQ